MKKNMCILVLAFLIICVVAACSNSDGGSGAQPGKESAEKEELVLAIGGEPEDGFDPTTGWGMYGSPLFQSTLLKFDKDFKVENDLAENYTVSEDGLLYTVEIREDVKFSDGEALTVEDVVFTFQTAKNSASVVDLSNLEKIAAVDGQTVEFTLKQPDSSFITRLTTMGIVPEHAYDNLYNENPIGSGPYKLLQWNKGQQLIVEINPYYYGARPEFKRLTFLFLEEAAAFAAAKAGEVDVVAIAPSYANQSVTGMRLVELASVDNRGISFPFVKSGENKENGNPIGNDVTADETIRKAIDMGINRQALVEGVLNGFGTPAYSVADGLPWWNPDTKIQDNQTEEAAEMLEEAGWKENGQGIREKAGLKAEFTLLYPAGDEVRQSLSIAAADQLKNLGIKVTPKGESWNELERLMHSNAVMMGWGSHDPLEMFNIYSSETRGEGFYNTNFYSNPAADDYMEKAMRATTQEEANSYWQKAQWDGQTGFSSKGDTPWVWLVNLEHLYLVNNYLDIGDQKLHPHGHGWPITDSIAQWRWTE